MLVEIYKQGQLKKRLTTTLGGFSWTNELMYTPQTSMTLPIEYAEYFDGREDVKIHINNKTFWGHVKRNYTLNKSDETIEVPIDHVVSEWEYRQISVNHAVADGKLNVVFKGDKVKKSTENDEGITANDFTITSKQVKKLTSKRAIEKAGAQAWTLSTGDPISITSVDLSKVKKADGDYKVTFSTAKGTSVTVTCTVNANVEKGGTYANTNKANKERISARRFTIDIGSVAGLTDASLIKIAEAKAWVYRHPNDEVKVTKVVNGIKEEAGNYEVTFSTAKGTSVTIKVRVTDIDDPTYAIDATIIDNIEDIYNDANFSYPGWQIDYQDNAGAEMINYVYSRQNKLEALTKTMELTEDLFWRVGFTDEKKIEIGKFGEKKPYTISLKPSGETNRRIIDEPTVTEDYENVINVATVYSDKSDSGMSSLSLREVHNNPNLQNPLFPVVILRDSVNNERDYTQYNAPNQPPKIAPNNEMEFAVIDTESVALESGILIEGTYAFNDLGAFNTDSRKITDTKRIEASQTAYKEAIRRLKQSRRGYTMEVTVEEMPADVNVGDRIRLIYDNSIWKLDKCSNYFKKIMSKDDWFYIERMTWDIDEVGQETNTLTLSKFIRIERETTNEI